MSEFASHAPHLLSGGQKQRVAIAGVIAMEPECIVLDEATAMLDPVGRQEVLSTVHRLNRDKGITVVLITHHMNEAEDADRVIVMDDGRVAMDGAPQEIFTHVEQLRSMGLTVPDTVALLYDLRLQGWDVPLNALTRGGVRRRRGKGRGRKVSGRKQEFEADLANRKSDPYLRRWNSL
jgi:energy-coupling factor transport system ATP-binding protein